MILIMFHFSTRSRWVMSLIFLFSRLAIFFINRIDHETQQEVENVVTRRVYLMSWIYPRTNSPVLSSIFTLLYIHITTIWHKSRKISYFTISNSNAHLFLFATWYRGCLGLGLKWLLSIIILFSCVFGVIVIFVL